MTNGRLVLFLAVVRDGKVLYTLMRAFAVYQRIRKRHDDLGDAVNILRDAARVLLLLEIKDE